ncbi:3-deoxy-D-manno-octulosonic acid transferase [Planctomycetes bacterium Pan216]|uniref:3-deoxy-D-manno-octulosonic acid transferase n=1 Tax=Kolteria novifilia TaxID=2527975 RepID=A0A518B5P1_9BACT|nr:3-deoxy-D-manno-octulosonic acid transferase [Planctomycetes bacterium Pan216]
MPPRILDALYLALLTLSLPYWLFKAATTGKYREGIASKLLGKAPEGLDGRPTVWIHAVSVGEVLLLRPLLGRLEASCPDYQFVLSTTTNTGYAVAKEKFRGTPVFYAPFDFTWAIRRVLGDLQPSLLMLVELELWPNLLSEAKRHNIPVVVINARMSERSFGGYQKIASLLRPSLEAIDWWGVQDQSYAGRIKALVGPSTAMTVTGSIKYDGVATERWSPDTNRLRRLLGFREEKILIAGSTMADEESMILDVWESLRQQFPELRLVLVPRHQERFGAVARLLEQRGICVVRRSQLDAPLDAPAPVTLVDTIGELGHLWGLADIAYVGGSMNCGRGGQSMIEPAAVGVPCCFGPETWNFRHTVAHLLEVRGAVAVDDARDLAATLEHWIRAPEEAEAMGQRARAFIRSQQGALDATAREIESRLGTGPEAQRQISA